MFALLGKVTTVAHQQAADVPRLRFAKRAITTQCAAKTCASDLQSLVKLEGVERIHIWTSIGIWSARVVTRQ
jgi:hypothetical protein